jgi:hypothetical protein
LEVEQENHNDRIQPNMAVESKTFLCGYRT